MMESITSFLETEFKRKVNNEKSAVAKPQERKFLGFSFTGGTKPKRRIAPKAKQRFRKKVREITRRKKGDSGKQRLEKLRQYLRGWRGYFGFWETPTVLQELDSWVRRRLPSCSWIQWKTRRRRFDGLAGLGVSRELAANTASSNRGPWYRSKSMALRQALPNAYFDSLGLARLAAGR
jgi:RNA-directed DNA polymerase